MKEDPSSLGAVSIKWEKGNSFRTEYEYTLNYLENKDFVRDTSTLKKWCSHGIRGGRNYCRFGAIKIVKNICPYNQNFVS